MHPWHGKRPTSLAGYLEAMSFAIFTAGINWRVVDAKWEGIREALSGFDVEAVAALTPADVDRLAADTRLIRNRRKIEGIIENAQRLLELDRSPGGFAGYLSSHGSFEAKVVDLKKNFRFLGETSAFYFLAAVGEPVPAQEECAQMPGSRRASSSA